MIFNSDEIQKIIPHRYPFLLVDRIDYMDEERIVGKKCVTANEMQFLGHFPEKHIFPGVLIVEALAQTGCVLLLSKDDLKGKLVYFAGINKMRFKKPVIPGDVIELEVKFISKKFVFYTAEVIARVEGEIVCEGEIFCAVGE